ncbi:hypothetical protein M3Y96_00707600 [Aphelenchoides besseyi]|nr:hypothetical protein M3Y96_00707600 [Aphelenchoides besseyi]
MRLIESIVLIKSNICNGMLYSCTTCLMSFNEPTQLIEHVESTHNQKSSKARKKKNKKNKKNLPNLKENSQKATKNLRFKLPCDQCPMMHKCKFCSTNFSTQGNLSEHLISNHMYIRVYYCNLCSQHVPTRADLAYHKARVHEKKVNLVRKVDFENETEDEGPTDEDIVSSGSDNEEHKSSSESSNAPKFMTPLPLIPRFKFTRHHPIHNSQTPKKKKRCRNQKRKSDVFDSS